MFSFSRDILTAQVLVGLSANLETTVEAEADSLPPYINHGGKNFVRSYISGWTGTGCAHDVSMFTPGVQFRMHTRNLGDERPAGSSVNVAMGLRHFGSTVGVIAPVGRGSGANRLDYSLELNGIERCFYKNGLGTPRTLTVLHKNGNGPKSTLLCVKQPYVYRPEIAEYLRPARPELLLLTGIKKSDLAFAKALIEQHPTARRALIPSPSFLTDPDLSQITTGLGLFQVNDDEAATILGVFTFEPGTDNIQALAKKIGAENTVITLGEHGAYLCNEYGVVHQPAYKSTVMDTSGAGDTHFAAFCFFHFLRGLDPCSALKMAAFAAGRKVAHVGPWSGLPTLAECEQELANGQ